MLLQAAAALVATFIASAQEAIRQATRSFTATALVAAHFAYNDAFARHRALAAALVKQDMNLVASRARAQDPLANVHVPHAPPQNPS